MKDLLGFLDGKKTYIVCGLAVGYLIVCQFAHTSPDQTILGIFGALGLGALRSGLSKPDEPKP